MADRYVGSFPGRAATDLVYDVALRAKATLARGGKAALVIENIEGAFNIVPYKLLVNSLRLYGVGEGVKRYVTK